MTKEQQSRQSRELLGAVTKRLSRIELRLRTLELVNAVDRYRMALKKTNRHRAGK